MWYYIVRQAEIPLLCYDDRKYEIKYQHYSHVIVVSSHLYYQTQNIQMFQ